MVRKHAGMTGLLATAAALAASGPLLAGTITGGVAFPGDAIPALTVVAVEEESGEQFTVSTLAGQRGYRLNVPAGRYIVFAIPHGSDVGDEPGQPSLRGAYTTFSLCVLGSPEKAVAGECQEHQLLTVQVGESETHKHINVYDWYLPDQEKARILEIKVATP